MKDSTSEPLGLLEIDTDIHYDLDLSKFPGLDDPETSSEPALLISSQRQCEAWFDIITKYDYDDEHITNEDVQADDGEDGCAFCDHLNVAEENDNCPHLTEPCYIRCDSPNRLYFFNDSHECETIEIMDEDPDMPLYLQCQEEEIEIETTSEEHEEKTYWLNTSNSDGSICSPESISLPSGSDSDSVIPLVQEDVSFAQLTACQYLFDDSDDISPPSPYMDMCITEQLPLFIDLVDQLSPVLSPSGHVRSRKGDNSTDYSVEADGFAQFLASDEGLLTIDTSMIGVNYAISKEATVFPRGS